MRPTTTCGARCVNQRSRPTGDRAGSRDLAPERDVQLNRTAVRRLSLIGEDHGCTQTARGEIRLAHGMFAIAFAVVLLSAACGTTSDGVVCRGTDSCEASCPSGICDQTCTDNGICEYRCSGGNCEQSCDQDSSCTLRCSGGNCDQRCTGDASCDLRCSGGNCTQLCETTGTCTTSCTGGNCGGSSSGGPDGGQSPVPDAGNSSGPDASGSGGGLNAQCTAVCARTSTSSKLQGQCVAATLADVGGYAFLEQSCVDLSDDFQAGIATEQQCIQCYLDAGVAGSHCASAESVCLQRVLSQK